MKITTIGCVVAVSLFHVPTVAQTQRTMTVNQLFELVESGNTALKAERSGIAVSTRGVEEAKSKRLPDVNAMLQLSYNGNVLMTDRDFSNVKGISQPHFGNSFALEAQQVVYSGGAINAGIRLAELQKEQSENSLDMSRDNQRFIALGQYLDLYRLENGIQVYDSNIALTEKLISDIQAKHQQGMALKNDITRYELQMESLKLGKRKLEDQHIILSHQLCTSLGIDDVSIKADIDLDKIGDDNGKEIDAQQRAAVESPMIKQSNLRVRMAEQQLKLAKSELYPKVAVVATDNFAGPFTYDLPPINNNFNIWYVGVGVKYSLSSLFKSNKSIRKAREQVKEQRELLALSGENVNNNVQQAYVMHQQSFVELHTQQKSVELARQNYEVVNNRYLSQLALVTDMIDASNTKLNAELQEVNAKINIAYTYYKLKYSTGEI